MRIDREYNICKAIARYLQYRYPDVLFHFDYAGVNLSKAQAGKMKAIQKGKGWPDLFIADPGGRVKYRGLFLELKVEGTELFMKRKIDIDSRPLPVSDHIRDQMEMIQKLQSCGYKCEFAFGLNDALTIIDSYMKL